MENLKELAAQVNNKRSYKEEVIFEQKIKDLDYTSYIEYLRLTKGFLRSCGLSFGVIA